MAQGKDIKLRGWSGGVNQVTNLKELGMDGRDSSGFLRSAVNVDVLPSGMIRRRHGYEGVQPGVGHSLWAPEGWSFALLVLDGQLTRLQVVNGAETLTPLLAARETNRWFYTAMNEAVYASNGVKTAKIDRNGNLVEWGVIDPAGQPLLAPLNNLSMNAGRYQVAITFQAPNGEESGTWRASLVAVPDGGGINLTSIPQPPAGYSVRIYCSPPDGENLYHVATLPAGVLTFRLGISHVAKMGRMLETQFCDRVPPCKFLCAFNGRIYFAIGDTLYYTLPLRFGLFKLHQTYFRFPDHITGVAAVDTGIYVGTQQGAYFLSGADPKDMQQRTVGNFGVVTNTMQSFSGTFGLQALPQEQVVMWWASDGVLNRGDSQGLVSAVTKGRLSLPPFMSGALLMREQDQLQQLVSVLKGGHGPVALAARDSATVSIVRNGVVIN